MNVLKARKTYNSRIHKGEEFDKYLFCEELFDTDGNLLELIEFDEEGEVVLKETRKYTDGNLSQIITENFLFDTEQKSEYIYQNGLLIEEFEYYNSESYLKLSLIYDTEKRVIRIEKIDEDGVYQGETRIEYTPSQDIKVILDETGKKVNQFIYDVNSNGDIVKVTDIEYIFIKNELMREEINTTKYTYQNENVIKEVVENSGKIFYKKECTYNSQNNRLSYTVFDHEVSYIVKGQFKYNSKNLVTEHTEFNGEIKVYTKELKYDSYEMISESVEKILEQDGYVSEYKQHAVNECW